MRLYGTLKQCKLIIILNEMKKTVLFLMMCLLVMTQVRAQEFGETIATMTTRASQVTISIHWSGSGEIFANGTLVNRGENTAVTPNNEGEIVLTATDNVQLTVLNCSNNQLAALDVSNCTELTILNCNENQISSLILPNRFEDFESIEVGYQQITVSVAAGETSFLNPIYYYHNPTGAGKVEINGMQYAQGEEVAIPTEDTTLWFSAIEGTYFFGTITINRGRDYVVSFETNSGSTIESQIIADNGTVTQPGNPALEGYTFRGWYKESTFENVWDFDADIVISNITLYAKWEINSYAITVSSNNNEYGVVNGNGSVDFGTETTVTATAITGYQFINWTENNQEVSTDSEYTFIVESDRALVANFTPIKYTITVSSNNDEYGVVNGNDSIDFATETTVTATATPGYQFINWTENNQEVSTDSEYKFIVENDRALIANFAPIKYTITVSGNNDEYGVVNGNNSIDFGTETTVTATANEGHRFINWTENGQEVSTDNIYTFTVENNRILVANFVVVNNTVVVEEPKPIESDGKGSIDFSLEIAGDASITGSFNIQLPEGYTLDETSTFLSETLAELFKLVITLAGDNTWRIEIVANGLRADQALPEYTKVMTIGYIVDETVVNGNYEIELKDIDMVLEDGTIIEQEVIVVATEVLRDDVGMSLVSSTPIIVYFQNENLVVKCAISEIIAVYDLSGVKLFQVIAQNDETYIPLPQGAYIIQVGNKTVKRIKK